MFAHLHVRSWHSFRAGGSPPEDLAAAATRRGVQTVAITDRHGVYGVVRFQRACKEHGIRHVFGAEVPIDGHDLVLIAENREGYANMCRLLTAAHVGADEQNPSRNPAERDEERAIRLKNRDNPSATLDDLAAHHKHLFCLTGTEGGPIYPFLDAGDLKKAAQAIGPFHEIFGERLSIEATHQRRLGDDRRLRRLRELSLYTGVPLVATGDVRYAEPDDYRRYDLLTCIRHRITVFDDHPDRPANDRAYLQSEEELRARGLPERALHRAGEVAAACSVDLIPGHIIPPGARLPEGVTPRDLFREKIRITFPIKYPPGSEHRGEAAERLQKEVRTIEALDVQEFFLVVNEVVEEARRRGIRCQGRGSAANSIVTYLLGITPVCPVEHNLLFERFLHRGRKGTPDIDLDFDSSRRGEIIAWMEERFGMDHTGMAATMDRYLTKSAVQDTAKALGWPFEMAIQMSKGCTHDRPDCPENAAHIRRIAGGPSPMLDALLQAATDLLGCPRFLGQHSGGMVLTRDPMPFFTPLQVSANGVRIVQFDKDDLEWLGLVKLDVLGLRMLGAVSEAVEIVGRHTGEGIDLDTLPFDHEDVYDMICEGDVLGLFQIESPAQQSAGARIQSRTMQDLIKQISLVRPGPILGGLMHPFIRRHRGLEPVRFDHPILEEILNDTYGVIIFQEQVLEVAHRFAGWSLDEADQFRRLMSKFRDATEMEGMRDRFVESAMQTNGVSLPIANRVFDQVSKFVGYGFCRSHAAAFALTVYHSAYLKSRHPGPFYAAVMQHRPGMYAQMTLEQDARRHGIKVLVPDINASGVRFDMEDGAIRKPLTSVNGIADALAKIIVLEREFGRFASMEDFFHRVPANEQHLSALAKAGAFDALEGSNRTALYKMKVLTAQYDASGTESLVFEGAHTLVDVTTLEARDIPALPGITLQTRLEWDLQTHSGPRVHPMIVLRRRMSDLEIRPIAIAKQFGEPDGFPYDEKHPPTITVAGLVMFRQRPATARGTMFIFLEDESGYIQCICKPDIRERYDGDLRESALVIRGKLQVVGPWRGIMVEQAQALAGVIGGYRGRPGRMFGRDEREVLFTSSTTRKPVSGQSQ